MNVVIWTGLTAGTIGFAIIYWSLGRERLPVGTGSSSWTHPQFRSFFSLQRVVYKKDICNKERIISWISWFNWFANMKTITAGILSDAQNRAVNGLSVLPHHRSDSSLLVLFRGCSFPSPRRVTSSSLVGTIPTLLLSRCAIHLVARRSWPFIYNHSTLTTVYVNRFIPTWK